MHYAVHTILGLTTHMVTETQVTPANKDKSTYTTPSPAYVTPIIHKNKQSVSNQNLARSSFTFHISDRNAIYNGN